MPRIYELPAMTSSPGVDQSTEYKPPAGAGSSFNQQRQPATKPMQMSLQMLEGQMKTGRRNVAQWFDAQADILSQQQLDPDKHRAAYGRLQQAAATKYAEVKAKATAQANHIQSMRKLVEAGTITSEQMEQTMLVMAGVPVEHVRRAFAQEKQQRPMARLRDLKYTAERIQAFQSRFVDHRTDIFGKGLWRKHPKTEKKTDVRANEKELQAYVDAEQRLYNIQKEMVELFNQLSPLEQDSQAGSQAVERYGMKQRGRLGRMAARGTFGLMGIGLAKLTEPRSSSEIQPALEEQPAFEEAISEPKSEAEYNALPKGTRYKHPDGSVRTKK